MSERNIDLLLPEVTIDEIIEAAQKVVEIWNTLGVSMTEAAALFRESFMKAFGYSYVLKEEEPKAKTPVRPEKKHSVSFRKCSRQPAAHYGYIPIAPRNLPYMRRAY